MFKRKTRTVEAVIWPEPDSSENGSTAEVTEITPPKEWRACPNCLVVASPSDSFCAACGSELPPFGKGPSDLLGEAPVPQAPVEVQSPTIAKTSLPSRVPHRRKVLFFGASAIFLTLGLTGVALLGVAWHSERTHKLRAEATLRGALASFHQSEAKLRATRDLVGRQQVLLAQTVTVLRRVDPLLTDVDRLQHVTSDIQAGRDTFSGDANSLVENMITLGNDLIAAANISGVDVSYLQSEIDTVNSEIDTVRYDSSSLSNYDDAYTAASTAFGNNADAFTKSVRQLQRALRNLSKK